tara:strand:- start:487 stop:3210 length:2724 start_codon:yes stop_codon:yes gene_type:complete
MASFDLDTFLKVQGKTGTGAVQALGMSFGMPSCMLNMAAGALNLLPSSVLTGIQSQVSGGKEKANELTAEVFKKLALNTGITEFDTENGVFKFMSDTSWQGIDNDDTESKNNLAGLLGAFQYAASFGAQLYENYNNITDQIDSITDCLDKFSTTQKFQSGNSASEKATLSPSEQEDLFNTTYAGDVNKLKQATTFINSCDATLSEINNILQARAVDPSLEPHLLNSSELDPFLDNTTFERFSPTDPAVGEEEKEVFRLTYGPPETATGQYVLTSDGLYYDSQAGGLDPVFLAISGIVPVGDKWKYDYDPNLGGKGQAISIESLNKFSDNIFDPTRIDDSIGLQHYYNEDHFLSVLKQQRDKNVYDLSSDLTSFIAEFGEDSSIVTNQRNLIISDIANHNSKINRRKKQIEVAVKAPQIYGEETQPKFSPGEIPINDFSYLADYNLEVDLEKQNALIFNQADVVGIVLPIDAKFAGTSAKPPSLTFDQLRVPTVGKGSILYSPSSTQAGTVLSLNDQIVYKDLFAIYNFLETKLELPSSLSFPVTNCATENMYNNAQMVGASKKDIFVSGLGIPYLGGIVQNKLSDPVAASALGSYVKLPDTKEYQDLTYSSTGFTLECWAHVPNIMDGGVGWLSATASSLTKVLLASENVGKSTVSALGSEPAPVSDLDYLRNNRGDEFVRGMVCGFTRDRRITEAGHGLGLSGYSNSNHDNDPVSSLSFFIAPTQSRDASSASWINDSDDCQDVLAFHKMKVDLSATDFGNVSSQFVLIDISCDPINDTIKMFADGSLVATSSVSEVFGTKKGIPPSLPNFKKSNSFQYSSTTVDGPDILKQGPLLNTFYTPWIVGGGYTDGMYKNGNFMGGDRGGITSGLRGHVGSLKFYSRPLDNGEVLKNYKAQQGFFKNIKI